MRGARFVFSFNLLRFFFTWKNWWMRPFYPLIIHFLSNVKLNCFPTKKNGFILHRWMIDIWHTFRNITFLFLQRQNHSIFCHQLVCVSFYYFRCTNRWIVILNLIFGGKGSRSLEYVELENSIALHPHTNYYNPFIVAIYLFQMKCFELGFNFPFLKYLSPRKRDFLLIICIWNMNR